LLFVALIVALSLLVVPALCEPVELPKAGVFAAWTIPLPLQETEERPCWSVTTPSRRVRLRVAQGGCRVVVSDADGQSLMGPFLEIPSDPSLSEWTLSTRWKGDTIRVTANGAFLGQMEDLPFQGGLWRMEEGFQDVSFQVYPLEEILFQDDFRREDEMWGDWRARSGQWGLVREVQPLFAESLFLVRGGSDENGFLETGHDFWDDHVFQSAVRLEDPRGAMGLVFGLQSAGEYHLLRWAGDKARKNPGTLALYRIRGETWTLLDRLEEAVPHGQWFQLSVMTRGPKILAGVNGHGCLAAEDAFLMPGRVGLWVEKGYACFDDVRLESVRPGMDGLSDPMAIGGSHGQVLDYGFHLAPVDWRWIGGDLDPWLFLWHDVAFLGDHRLQTFCALGTTTSGSVTDPWVENLCLSLCTNGKDPLSGYSFIYGGKDFPSRLIREGHVVMETDALLDSTHASEWIDLSLSKVQGKITGLVNGQLLMEFEDPQPLDGGRPALWSSRCGMLVNRIRLEYTEARRPSFLDLASMRREPWSMPGPASIVTSSFDPMKRSVLSFEFLGTRQGMSHLVMETNQGTLAGSLYGYDISPRDWVPLSLPELKGDGSWQEVSLDLGQQLARRMPWVQDWEVYSIRLEDKASRHALIPGLGALPHDEPQRVRRVKLGKERPLTEPEETELRCPQLEMTPDSRFSYQGKTMGVPHFRTYGSEKVSLSYLSLDPKEHDEFFRLVRLRLEGFWGLDTGVPPFDPAKYAWIAFEARSTAQENMSFWVCGNGYREEAVLKGGYHFKPSVGQLESPTQEDTWHDAIFCLRTSLARTRQSERPPLVTRLLFGETECWNRRKGDHFDVKHFELLSEIPAGHTVEVRPFKGGGVGYTALLRGRDDGSEFRFDVVEGDSFLLEGLGAGQYVLDVKARDPSGRLGPRSRTRLIFAEAGEDRTAPELVDLSPNPRVRSGVAEIQWRLEDEGVGVDFSSVRLTVGQETYDVASEGLVVDEKSGWCQWRPRLSGEPWPEGPVPCSLRFADLAGNQGQSSWVWHFTSLLDDEPPRVQMISKRPEPCLAWHDFEKGSEGWYGLAGSVTHWGRSEGPLGDSALELAQLRSGDKGAAIRMGFQGFKIKEWSMFSMDVMVDVQTGFSVLARIDDQDLEIQGKERLSPGVWNHVAVDLEKGWKGFEGGEGDGTVEYLLLQFEKAVLARVDHACLHQKTARSVNVRWPMPEDASGITLFRVAVTGEDVPPRHGWTDIKENWLEVQLEAVRQVYLHIVTRDQAGNEGEPATFLLQQGKSPQLH